MTRFRSYLAGLLAVLLVFAAYGDASALAMRDATGQMVICTGTGPVTIYVGGDGQPAAPPHPCPDCIPLTLDAGLQDPLPGPAQAERSAQRPAAARVLCPDLALAAPRARAPPFSG